MKHNIPLTLAEELEKERVRVCTPPPIAEPSRKQLHPLLIWGVCLGAIAAISLLGAFSFISVQYLQVASQAVADNERILTLVGGLETDIAEIDRIVIWFTLTGDDSFVSSYNFMLQSKDRNIAALREFTNNIEEASSDYLPTIIEQRCANAERVIQLRKTQGRDAAWKEAIGTSQAAVSNQIQASLDRLRKFNSGQVKILALQERKARNRCYGVILASTLGCAFLLAGVVLLVKPSAGALGSNGLNETLLSELLDYITDAVYVIDAKGRYLFANHVLRKLIAGDENAAVEGKTPFDFLSPHAAESQERDDQMFIRYKEPVLGRENKQVDANGKERWFQTTKVPLFSAEGKFMALISIQRDITDLRLAQPEIPDSKAPAARVEPVDAIRQSSTATGELPAVQLAPREAPIPVNKEPELLQLTPSERHSVTGHRVLVANHDASTQFALDASLSAWELDVKFADDSFEALSEIWKASEAKSPYHLVILDAVLSPLDGFDLARNLKSEKELQAIPLILLFSDPENGNWDKAKNAGFETAISTPIRPRELLNALLQTWSKVDNAPAKTIPSPTMTLLFDKKESHPAPTVTLPFPAPSANGIVYTKEQLLSNYGDEDLLKTLITLFLDQLPVLLSDMDDSLQSKNFESLARTAHSLKGSVGNFGAKNAWIMAQTIESAATARDLDAAAASALKLKEELRGAIEVLLKYQ